MDKWSNVYAVGSSEEEDCGRRNTCSDDGQEFSKNFGKLLWAEYLCSLQVRILKPSHQSNGGGD